MSLRLVLISDTHNRHDLISVPDGDVLIHAGDATVQGTEREVAEFAEWFSVLPHRYKIFVAGNHDWLFERKPIVARNLLGHSIFYLQDSAVEIEGVKFYGSPWQPEFRNWAFNLPRGKALADKWALIPFDTQVLITHGPPFGMRDEAPDGLRKGCRDLLKEVKALYDLKIHAFGHIHSGYGQIKMFGTHFINAAICSDAYQPVNAPIVFDI